MKLLKKHTDHELYGDKHTLVIVVKGAMYDPGSTMLNNLLHID